MDKIKHLLEQQQYQQRHDEHLHLQQHRKTLYAEVTEWLKQIGDDHEVKVLGDDYYIHLRLGYDQELTLRFSPLSLNRSDQIATELTLFELCAPNRKLGSNSIGTPNRHNGKFEHSNVNHDGFIHGVISGSGIKRC